MKKIIGVLIFVVVIMIFLFSVFNSKRDYYENHQEFYKGYDFNAEIIKIVEGRGTKIYYSEQNYFYSSIYEGAIIEKGDLIKKHNTIIDVYRKNNNTHKYILIGSGEIIKPKNNYYEYFFFGL
jgi:hypothetical protein